MPAARPAPRLPANLVSHALRRLWRHRGLTTLVVASLALGIGVNTALFSVADAVLLAPLPVHDPNTLVSVHTVEPNSPRHRPMGMSHANLSDLEARNRVFSSLAASTVTAANLHLAAETREVPVESVTPAYFQTLGLRPVLGTLFSTTEGKSVGAPPAAISYAFWGKHFQFDRTILGRTFEINRAPFQITGVLPRGYKGLDRLSDTQIWVPLHQSRPILDRPDWIDARRALMFFAVARLQPGISPAEARRNVGHISGELAALHPVDNKGRTFDITPLSEMVGEFRPDLVRSVSILFTASLIVLLIAVANAGHALLARTAVRRREMAILVALGGTRRDLLLPILTEGLLLVLLGAAAGLLLGLAGRELLWAVRPDFITADNLTLGLNLRVLGFVAALSLAAGLGASLIPALHALRGDIAADLKERTTRSLALLRFLGLRQGLLVSQVALSLVAVVSAHLFVTSFRHAQAIDPGFDTNHLATFEINPKRLGLHGDARLLFYLELEKKLESLEGVQSVSLTSNPLLGPDNMRRTAYLPGGVTIIPRLNMVSTGFFQTADVLILRGRSFTPADRDPYSPVAVINESMARRYFNGTTEALGRKFRLYGDNSETTIVGVARDVDHATLGESAEPCVYVPLRQTIPAQVTALVRANVPPTLLQSRIHEALRGFRPDLAKPEIVMMSQVVDQALWAPRTAAALLALFALLAVILASAGVYGVTRQFVRQRTADLGVRVALGACPVDVAGFVVRQCLVLVLPGLAAGTVLAYGLAHWLYGGLLYTVSEHDVQPYAWGTLLLGLVALLASYLPARRAARMQPAVALREP